MPRLNDTVRAALGYWWNLISDAARTGFTVTETIEMANQVARDMGTTLSFGENTAISQLYGHARSIENSGATFQAASAEQGITSDMMATPPWARDVAEQATYPLYYVKFEYTYLDQSGQQQTGIRTSVFTDQLPSTVGDLTSDVLSDAEGMAQKYGHTLLSAVPLQILAV